jgi:hypothetical protein
MKGILSVTVIAVTVFLVIAPAISAEESHEGADAFHRHHVGLIAGGTFDEHDRTGPAIGVDYEYRFNRRLGLGGLLEYAGGDFEHVLLGIPIFFHPNEHWLLALAPATEVHKDEKHDERKRDWVVRASVAYQFHFGDGYSVSPVFSADFSEHETLYVAGLALAFGWQNP